MVDASQAYDQRIYNYLRWISQKTDPVTLTQAWNDWRDALPLDIKEALQTLSDIFRASAEHEREQMIAQYPEKVIDAILPKSFEGLSTEYSPRSREAYRRYVHDLGLIASSIDPRARSTITHAVLPYHVSRSLREALRTQPLHIDGIRRAAESIAPKLSAVPRPPHTQHSTVVRIHDTAAHCIDWSIRVHPRTGAYSVQWEKVRNASVRPLSRQLFVEREPHNRSFTIIAQPQSLLQRERYYTISQSEVERFAHSSAVPVTLYDDGTLSQHPIVHAQPVLTMRVTSQQIEFTPSSHVALSIVLPV